MLRESTPARPRENNGWGRADTAIPIASARNPSPMFVVEALDLGLAREEPSRSSGTSGFGERVISRSQRTDGERGNAVGLGHAGQRRSHPSPRWAHLGWGEGQRRRRLESLTQPPSSRSLPPVRSMETLGGVSSTAKGRGTWWVAVWWRPPAQANEGAAWKARRW